MLHLYRLKKFLINNALKEELAGESVVSKFAIPKKYGRKEGVVQMQSVVSIITMNSRM